MATWGGGVSALRMGLETLALIALVVTSPVLASAQDEPTRFLAGWIKVRTFNTTARPSGLEWSLSRAGGYLLAGPLGRKGVWSVQETGRLSHLYQLKRAYAVRTLEDPYLFIFRKGGGAGIWHMEQKRLVASAASSSSNWRWMSPTRLLEIVDKAEQRLRVWRWQDGDKLRLMREIKAPQGDAEDWWFSTGGRWVYGLNALGIKAWRIDLDSGTQKPFPALIRFYRAAYKQGAVGLYHAGRPDWALSVAYHPRSVLRDRKLDRLRRVCVFRFDLNTGKTLPTIVLEKWKGGFSGLHLAFSPDGKHGLLGNVYFEVGSGKMICRLDLPPQMKFFERARLHPRWPLALVSLARRLAVFELKSGKLRYLADQDHLYSVIQLAFLGKNKLASLDNEGRVLLRDLSTGRIEPLVQAMPAYKYRMGGQIAVKLRGLTPLPDGRGVLLHFADGPVRGIFDSVDGPIRTVLAREGKPVTQANKRKHLVFDGKAIGFRKGGKQVLVNPRPFLDMSAGDSFDTVGQRQLAKASTEVRVYDTSKMQLLRRLQVSRYLRAVVLSDRMLALVTYSARGGWQLEGYDTTAGKLLWRRSLAKLGIEAMPVIQSLPDATFLLSSSSSSKGRCLRISSQTGKIGLTYFKGPFYFAKACLRRGQIFIKTKEMATPKKARWRVFALASGKPVAVVNLPQLDELAISPDGRQLAVSRGERITIFRRKRK